MPITVKCKCGKLLKFPDGTAGRQGKCSACGAIVAVAEEDEEEVKIAVALKPDQPSGASRVSGVAGVLLVIIAGFSLLMAIAGTLSPAADANKTAIYVCWICGTIALAGIAAHGRP